MVNLNINARWPVSRQIESDFVIQILVDVLAPAQFSLEASDLVEDQRSHANDRKSDAESFESRGRSSEEVNMHDFEEEFLVGRIWAERIDWYYAEECGFSIAEVCDARSGTWMQVLETLCRGNSSSFRKELQIESFVNEVLFIHEILLHPDIIDRVAILDAAIRGISSDNSLILMYHEQSEPYHLEDWECNEIGFKKIARSNLLLRDNHFTYPFAQSYSSGRPVNCRGSAEHEEWVLENWEELISDHPSL